MDGHLGPDSAFLDAALRRHSSGSYSSEEEDEIIHSGGGRTSLSGKTRTTPLATLTGGEDAEGIISGGAGTSTFAERDAGRQDEGASPSASGSGAPVSNIVPMGRGLLRSAGGREVSGESSTGESPSGGSSRTGDLPAPPGRRGGGKPREGGVSLRGGMSVDEAEAEERLVPGTAGCTARIVLLRGVHWSAPGMYRLCCNTCGLLKRAFLLQCDAKSTTCQYVNCLPLCARYFSNSVNYPCDLCH